VPLKTVGRILGHTIELIATGEGITMTTKIYKNQPDERGVYVSRVFSFPPLVNDSSQVLILGTLPGAESLRLQQYYAKKQNVFWRLFGSDPDEDYSTRCDFILSRKLSLWDVYRSGERSGSADSKIVSGEPNDIAGLLSKYPNIKRILLNGRTAEDEYRRHFASLSIPAVYVPSTSPAYARMSFKEKKEAWEMAMGEFL
jgi:hypoxanthine-DNA glycosylase